MEWRKIPPRFSNFRAYQPFAHRPPHPFFFGVVDRPSDISICRCFVGVDVFKRWVRSLLMRAR